MNIRTLALAILVFLALSSGATKLMLMEQDVAFFGKYGFSNPLLIGFGALQICGGALMLNAKWRVLGAGLVALTFAASAVLLIQEGNVPFTLATLLALIALGMTIRHTIVARRV